MVFQTEVTEACRSLFRKLERYAFGELIIGESGVGFLLTEWGCCADSFGFKDNYYAVINVDADRKDELRDALLEKQGRWEKSYKTGYRPTSLAHKELTWQTKVEVWSAPTKYGRLELHWHSPLVEGDVFPGGCVVRLDETKTAYLSVVCDR